MIIKSYLIVLKMNDKYTAAENTIITESLEGANALIEQLYQVTEKTSG